jgi:hypothetical protein
MAAVVLAIAGVGAAVGILVTESGGPNGAKHLTPAAFATSGESTGTSPLTQPPSSGEESPSSSASSTEPPSSPTQPETAPSASTTQSNTTPPPTPAALAAINRYWGDVRAHDFAKAYAYLVAGAVESESQFVANERRARITSVQFNGEVTSSSEATATVGIVSLITRDAQYGCRSWTGSYEMTNGGSGWQIARANLSPKSCSG